MISKFQRKCFLASASLHGLLFVVLLVGPAFLLSKEEANDLPTLEFIPAKLIDDQFYRVTAPQPQPAKPPPQQPARMETPKPPKETKAPEPKPVVKAPEPKPEPKYTKAENIRVNLNQHRPKSTPQPRQPSRQVYTEAAKKIRQATSSTTIEMPSMPAGGGEAYANYAQVVKSIYEHNWIPPAETSRDDALVKVQIVIARDGTILSSRVISRSGEAGVDASVEATLRRVTKVRPFPAGATESKRTYTIGFNLKAKRAMG